MEPLYKNPNASIEDRIADLMGRMTLDEKLNQLCMFFHFDRILKQLDEGTYPELGYATSYLFDAVSPADINRVQKMQLENTRLGIPLMLHGESVHGLMYRGSTIFPMPIGMACSFNPELVGEAADVIGKEMKLTGVRQTYAPNIDLSRDPRWGRTEENYGEDPYLTARMGVAYVKNLQKHQVAATPKHYLAHGSPEGGINAAPTTVGERMVRETMLEPFRAAVQEGGCLSIMPAYSEIDGVPMHSSYHWLTEVLRGELGFEGTIVSDSGGIYELIYEQGAYETPEEAGIAALMAGVDHELPYPFGFGEGLKKAIEEGRVPMSRVDDAVARNLRMKFRLGLFEEPYVNEETIGQLHAPESAALTRRVAHESVVLLKNNGVLPLSKDIRKVAVVGPNSDYPRLGGYTTRGCEEYSVSPLEGIKNVLGEDRVVAAKGCCVAAPSDLGAAIKAAEEADVVIAVLGDNSNCWFAQGWGDDEGGNIITCGEGRDSSTLELPKVQKELLRELKKVGKPIVLILETGRPYAIVEENGLCDALMAAWYPGEQGGNALADLLFGDVNPSGKLPITFPKSVGHIPCYYNYKAMARTPHLDLNAAPQGEGFDKRKTNLSALYEFGFGLSYTTFEYSDLAVNGDKVTVKVTNTGDRAGKESVLMYITHHYCPVTRFVKRLRGFTKIELQPGETKEVTFTITDEDLSYVDIDYKTSVGVGKFTVTVGGLEASFTR